MIQVLHYVGELFEKENIPYWLHFGSLLGALRNGKIIPWDSDIDFGIFKEDRHRIFDLKRRMLEDGYILSVTDYEPDLWQVRYSYYNWSYCDLWLYDKVPPKEHLVETEKTLYDFEFPPDTEIVSEEIILKSLVPWFQVNHTCDFPFWFVKEMEKVELEGRMFDCPRWPRDFVRFIYGPDWEVPLIKNDNVWLGNYYPLSKWLEFVEEKKEKNDLL